MLDDFNYELPALQPTHAAFEETHEGKKNQLVGYNKQVPLPVPPPSSLASLELLRNYGSRFKRLRGQNILTKTQTCASPKKLSSEDIIRLAGARYIQHSTTQWHDTLCIPMYPYYGSALQGLLSEEENRDVELAQFLLAAAERVGCQQFQRANMLLSHFHHWNNSSVPAGVGGSPVQRVVFHFAQALRERIKKETGGGGGRVLELIKGSDERLRNEERELIDKLELDTNIAITCHQKLPFNQVMQFAGVQAIVEHVASKTKIHIIDLDIGCGVMCTCIRRIKPCIMIVLEVEANHISPSFVNRFVEALFFYSAYFDCIETCMKQNHEYECRVILEAILSEGIRNIVAMEDGERTVRNVRIDVWRRFFARYRMVETGFSESSMYQANLVAKKFACGSFCTIDKNGKCLIVGWKGTPIHSISAWKFL